MRCFQNQRLAFGQRKRLDFGQRNDGWRICLPCTKSTTMERRDLLWDRGHDLILDKETMAGTYAYFVQNQQKKTVERRSFICTKGRWFKHMFTFYDYIYIYIHMCTETVPLAHAYSQMKPWPTELTYKFAIHLHTQ